VVSVLLEHFTGAFTNRDLDLTNVPFHYPSLWLTYTSHWFVLKDTTQQVLIFMNYTRQCMLAEFNSILELATLLLHLYVNIYSTMKQLVMMHHDQPLLSVNKQPDIQSNSYKSGLVTIA